MFTNITRMTYCISRYVYKYNKNDTLYLGMFTNITRMTYCISRYVYKYNKNDILYI